MIYLKKYEGFFDFLKGKKKESDSEVTLFSDIIDCYIDLEMLDVKDDLINGDILDRSLFRYPFREDDLEKSARELMDYHLNRLGLESFYRGDNYITFHIQFLENPEVEKVILNGSEKVKNILNCKVKIFRRKVLNKIENSENIYEHFVTISIKSNSKII